MATKKRRSSATFSRTVAPFAPLALALTMGATLSGGRPASTTSQASPTTQASQTTTATGGELDTGFSQACTAPQFPSDTPTAMDGTSCSVSGSGGKETWQNEAKNNFCATGDAASPTTPIPTTIQELVALQAKAQDIPNINFGNPRDHPLTSAPGPVQDRSALAGLGEGKLVQLIGFVKLARQEGAESVNCGSNVPNDPVHHDIHISIVLSPADPECAGVVVEMTPHHRPTEWNATKLNQVAKAGLLVRVTGQRMFDSSHTPCINGSPNQGDPSRISLWEVHPVYKFEVCPQGNCASGGWLPLTAWNNS